MDTELVKARNLIHQGVESLEMVYNFHEGLVGHNEIMWSATKKISKGLEMLEKVLDCGFGASW